MNMKLRSAALAVAALVAAPLIAYGAGNWSTLPIVGGASFCGSTVSGTGSLSGITGQGQGTTGSICGQTIPAGPPFITGVEIIPADTNLTGGAPPQTVGIPDALLGAINPKVNRLIGGDFATNLWQRGTTPVSAATPTTSVLGADRWAVYSSGNTVTVTKQTGANDSIPSLGLYASMRVNRPSGTDVTPILVGQTLDKNASQSFIGNNAVCSFYAVAGAGFSAASSNLTVTPAYYTAADSATPLTNTDSFMKATTTGYQAAATGSSVGTTASIASGVATIPISTTWTRYSIYAAIPATNAAGTAVTGFGLKIGYTPVGTGGATDWFEIEGVQCQSMPATATAVLPAGVTAPTGFERRSQADETERQLSYSYVITDGAITQRYGWCQEKVANTSANCTIQFPQQMRGVPTTTVSATGWSIQQTDATNELCSALAGIASSNTVLQAGLLCTAPGTIALGTVSPFLGGATTSLMTFSAEP